MLGVKGPHSCWQVFVSGEPQVQNSGLQGFFEWRAHSVATDDGGVVIKPLSLKQSDPGRWHRVFDGPLSVKWFGATGDGTSDDIAAIQACITSAESTPVPCVQFPPGQYRITRAIIIQADNFTVSGNSQATLIIDPTSPIAGQPWAPEAILVNRGPLSVPPARVNRVTIRVLAIEAKGGSDPDSFSAGVIQVNNCTDCVIRDVQVVYNRCFAKA